MTFELKEDQEFIQLNNLLQLNQVAQTGGHAKVLVRNEEVKVNGAVETQVRKKIRSGDIVEIESLKIEVK